MRYFGGKQLTIAAIAAATISTLVHAQQPAFGPAERGQSQRNTIGMEFILIPAGSFLMGSPAADREATNFERPQHEVTISKPFYLAQFEVTQEQWQAVLGSNPYTRDRSNPYYNLPGMAERITQPDHPATVSWNDAQEFIARLNKMEGHNRYRLPSEAEWEYAARARTTTAYSFGDNGADLSRYAGHGEDFVSGGTHPVGKKEPNPWGLYDIHGNAWEWVQDWFDASFYSRAPKVDQRAPNEALSTSCAAGAGMSRRRAGVQHSAATTRPIIAASALAFGSPWTPSEAPARCTAWRSR